MQRVQKLLCDQLAKQGNAQAALQQAHPQSQLPSQQELVSLLQANGLLRS